MISGSSTWQSMAVADQPGTLTNPLSAVNYADVNESDIRPANLNRERHMKRKGPRAVPDFSRKPKARPDAPAPDPNAPPPPPTSRVTKPNTLKSGGAGRRGG
jgi:hypothetical protein